MTPPPMPTPDALVTRTGRPDLRRQVRHRSAGVLVAGLLAMLATTLGAAPAHADATPPFELPLACGQTWWGATYASHSRYWAIDFNTFNGDDWERGQPVLASAAGTVTASDYQASGAGNRVMIDHGGGWETAYYHLEARTVSAGQPVARGAQIGTVGGTPSYPVHLHYEQRSGGSAVPAVFSGVPFTYTEFDIPNGYQGLPVTSKNCAPVITDPCGPFGDVDAASGFCDDILWLVGAEITSGFADGSYRPADIVSRQSMAAFLWRMSGQPITGPPTFTDVDASHPFGDAIGWLAWAGIATGNPDGSFGPTAGVSRQAMAAFLWRLAGSPPPAGAPTFSDVGASDPLAPAIAWLAGTGITSGYPDGSFRPQGLVSRQQMAAFLHRSAG